MFSVVLRSVSISKFRRRNFPVYLASHQHLASPVSMLLLWNVVIHNSVSHLVSTLYRDFEGASLLRVWLAK